MDNETSSERSRGFGSDLTWGCYFVFTALLLASGLQCWTTFQQRSLLRQARENANNLVAQAQVVQQQLEPRLEAFSMELIDVAKTNEVARQIVRQFNIKYQGGNAGAGNSQ